MKVINLSYPLQLNQNPEKSVLAAGFFDGVHLGHQKVIKTAKQAADENEMPLSVLTYDHHPSLVYKKLEGDEKRYLTPMERKLELFEELGVNTVYVVNYNYAFQSQRPQEFVDNYLVKLNPDTVVAGFDHTYGEKDATMVDLGKYARGRFQTIAVEPEIMNGQKVSSTRIRQAFSDGEVDLANQLLGYQFQNEGTVVHGYARGRTLGFPTANIEYSVEQRLPKLGVYAVEIQVNGVWLEGMASIGRNETFGPDNPVTLEINILDFNEDIYGNNVKVRWCTRLRDSFKFDGKEALVRQLEADEQDTRNYFKNASNN